MQIYRRLASKQQVGEHLPELGILSPSSLTSPILENRNCQVLQSLHIIDLLSPFHHLKKNFYWNRVVLQWWHCFGLLWLSNIPLYIRTTFSYPIICQWTFRLLPGPACCKQCCHKHRGAASFQIMGFSGYMPRSGISGSYGSSILVF